jgi:hypothetical protein
MITSLLLRGKFGSSVSFSFVVLRDDLISVPRWGLEMRLHHFSDCVSEEAQMLRTAVCISEDVGMDERHVGQTARFMLRVCKVMNSRLY